MDAALGTGKYPAYTLAQLKGFVSDGKGTDVMIAEIARREAVAAGDRSQMSPAERLTRARMEKAS